MAHGAWAGSAERPKLSSKLSAQLSPRPVSLERDRANEKLTAYCKY